MIWNLDPVLLRLGPLEVRYYGLCFVAALYGGFLLWKWQMTRGGRSESEAERFLIPAAIAVIVGARLGHVVFYEPDRFFSNPVTVLYVWQGGLASHGATIGLMLTLWWFSRTSGMKLMDVCDRFVFSAAWGAALVRLGNFLNSEIVGRPTTLPWGVKFPRFDAGIPMIEVPVRHPSQLYEFVMGLGVLGALLLIDRRLGGEKRKTGVLGCSFLILYFTARFLVEFVKAQQGLPEDYPITMGQVLSMPFIVLGFVGLFLVVRQKAPSAGKK